MQALVSENAALTKTVELLQAQLDKQTKSSDVQVHRYHVAAEQAGLESGLVKSAIQVRVCL